RKMNEVVARDRKTGGQILAIILPSLSSVPGDESVVIQNVNPVGGRSAQFSIDLPDGLGLAGPGLCIQDSSSRTYRLLQIVDNKCGWAAFPEGPDPALETGGNSLACLPYCLRR